MLFYSLTIFLSAFLLFQVQPVIAKMILPWFGGSSAVWSTCMLFFQIVLLLGYLYAHFLNKLAPRKQAVIHLSLLAVSLATLPITRNDFGEFDLHLEYWTKTSGNSGVSIRDNSRAKWGVITPPDYTKTPSKIGYEIQINNRFPDPHPSGSIYGFADAPKDASRDDDWNAMDIISRNAKISIKLNGRVVAEHPGDPQRPKGGPIGLQLHDQFSIVMFRNIKITEILP